MTACSIEKIYTIILCGGLGKRIRKVVPDRPKSMAKINRLPFLDFLIDYILSYGIKNIILCVGYQADFIKEYYLKNNFGIKILFSDEDKPLGTAGAIKNAQEMIKSSPFIVMNGDSICKIDLADFLNFHMRKKALASIALINSKDLNGRGVVELDSSQKILTFHEKGKISRLNDYFINAGIYIFEKEMLSLIPENKNYSLEYDLFSKLPRFFGYLTEKPLIEIGTLEGYRKAKLNLQYGQGNNE